MTSPDHLVHAIARRQHGAFSSVQVPALTDAHIRSRIACGRWARIQQTVFIISGTADTWEQRIWIALLTAGGGAVVGRRTAAVLHGIPGIARGPVDIVQPERTVPNVKSADSRRTNRLPAWQVTDCQGFPITTVERTLFDLAGMTSLARRRSGRSYIPAVQVERMVDDALTRDMVTVPSLQRLFLGLACRGRPGSKLMRELLETRGAGFVVTESRLEDLFMKLVATHGLPTPRQQVQVGSDMSWIGRIDFLFDDARLIVETDGRRFHSGRAAAQNDRNRDLDLLASGWQLLRVGWWQLVDDADHVARQLRTILATRSSLRSAI